MNQKEIVKRISKKTRIRPDAIQKILRSLNIVLCEALDEGEEMIRLTIGIFETKISAPKAAYNFKTHEKMTIPPTEKLVFKPALRIQQMMDQKNINNPKRNQLVFKFEDEEV